MRLCHAQNTLVDAERELLWSRTCNQAFGAKAASPGMFIIVGVRAMSHHSGEHAARFAMGRLARDANLVTVQQ